MEVDDMEEMPEVYCNIGCEESDSHFCVRGLWHKGDCVYEPITYEEWLGREHNRQPHLIAIVLVEI